MILHHLKVIITDHDIHVHVDATWLINNKFNCGKYYIVQPHNKGRQWSAHELFFIIIIDSKKMHYGRLWLPKNNLKSWLLKAWLLQKGIAITLFYKNCPHMLLSACGEWQQFLWIVKIAASDYKLWLCTIFLERCMKLRNLKNYTMMQWSQYHYRITGNFRRRKFLRITGYSRKYYPRISCFCWQK